MSNGTLPILEGLGYLFTHADGAIIAHCLDLDIVASGVDMAEAEESLNAMVLVQIASCFTSGNLRQLLTRAPQSYWDTLDRATLLEHAQLEGEVPPVILPVEKRVARL